MNSKTTHLHVFDFKSVICKITADLELKKWAGYNLKISKLDINSLSCLYKTTDHID